VARRSDCDTPNDGKQHR
jgi:hypothetical protein